MNINFKWSVGDVVKMPVFTADLVDTTIIERRFREDKNGAVIEYETDMFENGTTFTQDEIEKYNAGNELDTEKMKIERDISEAIELFLDDEVRVMKRSLEQGKGIFVAQHYGQDWTKFEFGQFEALNKISTFDLMKCLVNGYEII